MKNKVIILLFLCISMLSYGQRKYTANKYFEELAYQKAAELYEKIYNKGKADDQIIGRIADSHYYNTETEKAAVWYKKLGTKLSKEQLYRYAQVLRSNGDFKASDSIVNIHFKELAVAEISSFNPEERYYISNLIENSPEETIKIQNVATNTAFSDFGGFIHNNEFYFASTASKKKKKYKWNNQPYLDVYVSKIKDSAGLDLENKQKLPKRINTKYHEASVAITKDGKTMYFTRVNYHRKRLRKNSERVVLLSIYKASLVDGKWKHIKKLPFCSSEYSVGHPALSSDEKTLYFISNMAGGYGKTDIYKVAVHNDGTYGTPKNLGKKINTIGREMFPFVGGKDILYFSSDGHKGEGALDIFEAKINENNDFGVVKNLKTPFNSNLDDFGFVVDEDVKKGFFSSNRAGGKGDDDIYSFLIPDAMHSKSDSLIKKKEELIVENETLTTKKDSTNLVVDSLKEPSKKEKETSSLIVGNEINVNPIYFDFDKHSIRKDAKPELDKVVKVLQENPEMVIKIESHTDNRGSKTYNKKLSDKRAKATRDYILSKGIAAQRIESAIGYGEDKLLSACNNCTEAIHQKNRRSHFYIVENEDVTVLNSVDNQIVANPIYFDFDNDNIRKDSKKELDKLVETVQNDPEISVKIESHTDSRGSKTYNKKLSDKRAKATKEYLITKGVSPLKIISAQGFGEERLLNDCNDAKQKYCSDKEHQLNRRSFFYLIRNKEQTITKIRSK